MATVVVSDGGTYSSIEAAVDASSASDTISIEGTWTGDDSTRVTLDVANLTITADADSQHPGYAVASPSHYRHRVTGPTEHSFTVSVDVTLIEKIEIGSASTTTSDEIFRIDADNVDMVVEKCLLYFASRNSEQDIYYNNSKNTLTVTFENCIIWNAYRAVIDTYGANDTCTANINSCTIYDVGFSASSSSRSGVFGCAGGNSFLTAYMYNSTAHINTGLAATAGTTGNTCVIDRSITNQSTWLDAAGWVETIDDSFVSHNWTADDSKSSDGDWVIVESITGGPYYDLRLATNAYNDAQDIHTDITGPNSMGMPGTDIVGTVRPQNTNYDIGASEVAAAGFAGSSKILGGGITV